MLDTEHKWTLRARRVSLETLIESPLTSMTLVFFRFYMLSEEDIPGSRSRDIGYGFVDLGRPGWEQLESMG